MAIAEHSTTESSIERFPNDPSEYTPNEPHFYQMKRDRNIHGYIIRDCFENGRLEKARGDRWKFVHTVDGFEWWFIVEHRHGMENELVTAYIPEFENDDRLYEKHI